MRDLCPESGAVLERGIRVVLTEIKEVGRSGQKLFDVVVINVLPMTRAGHRPARPEPVHVPEWAEAAHHWRW